MIDTNYQKKSAIKEFLQNSGQIDISENPFILQIFIYAISNRSIQQPTPSSNTAIAQFMDCLRENGPITVELAKFHDINYLLFRTKEPNLYLKQVNTLIALSLYLHNIHLGIGNIPKVEAGPQALIDLFRYKENHKMAYLLSHAACLLHYGKLKNIGMRDSKGNILTQNLTEQEYDNVLILNKDYHLRYGKIPVLENIEEKASFLFSHLQNLYPEEDFPINCNLRVLQQPVLTISLSSLDYPPEQARITTAYIDENYIDLQTDLRSLDF